MPTAVVVAAVGVVEFVAGQQSVADVVVAVVTVAEQQSVAGVVAVATVAEQHSAVAGLVAALVAVILAVVAVAIVVSAVAAAGQPEQAAAVVVVVAVELAAGCQPLSNRQDKILKRKLNKTCHRDRIAHLTVPFHHIKNFNVKLFANAAAANANTGGSTIALPGLRPGELKMTAMTKT